MHVYSIYHYTRVMCRWSRVGLELGYTATKITSHFRTLPNMKVGYVRHISPVFYR
jgi:hypothetical protein